MKVALCISGQARTWEQNRSNIIDNVISNYNCKIFTATDVPLAGITPERSIFIPDLDVYKNKLEKITKHHHWGNHNGPIPILKWMYKLYKCNELKKEFEQESDEIFDIVIRMRPDTVFTKKVELKIVNNTIVLCRDTLKDHLEGYSDIFWFCDSKTMDKVCELYFRINEYIDSGSIFHPETLLKHHCLINGIALDRVDADFSIVR